MKLRLNAAFIKGCARQLDPALQITAQPLTMQPADRVTQEVNAVFRPAITRRLVSAWIVALKGSNERVTKNGMGALSQAETSTQRSRSSRLWLLQLAREWLAAAHAWACLIHAFI
jgi:hypothetical protein